MKALHIVVKPSASHDEVEEISSTEFLISTPAPIKDGRANREAMKLLARHLHVSPASLVVSGGERWNEKTVLLVD